MFLYTHHIHWAVVPLMFVHCWEAPYRWLVLQTSHTSGIHFRLLALMQLVERVIQSRSIASCLHRILLLDHILLDSTSSCFILLHLTSSYFLLRHVASYWFMLPALLQYVTIILA